MLKRITDRVMSLKAKREAIERTNARIMQFNERTKNEQSKYEVLYQEMARVYERECKRTQRLLETHYKARKIMSINAERYTERINLFTKNNASVDGKVNFSPLENASTAATEGLAAGAATGATAVGLMAAFGTASTGTALSALHGAAFTNALLAAFGGGSVAAGGLGMMGGALALGATVALPAIAIGGYKYTQKLDKAYEESVELATLLTQEEEKLNKVVKSWDRGRMLISSVSEDIHDASEYFRRCLNFLMRSVKSKHRDEYCGYVNAFAGVLEVFVNLFSDIGQNADINREEIYEMAKAQEKLIKGHIESCMMKIVDDPMEIVVYQEKDLSLDELADKVR